MLLLAGCAGQRVYSPAPTPAVAQGPATGSTTPPQTGPVAYPQDGAPLPPTIVQGKSRWVAVRWAELPGFDGDTLFEAWNAWTHSCERPGPALAPLCADVRRLSLATPSEQRNWMQSNLQPYRVEALSGVPSEGLLTGYYEPMLGASHLPGNGYTVPLHRTPSNLTKGKPWYTRQEADTLPEAKAALRGREIAYLADPLDALMLHIQGSGRLRITEADGSTRNVRLAYAGSNEQPYKSVGRWLLDQGAIKDASWPGIKAWAQQNPQRVQELLWSNPRLVFFTEAPLSDPDTGPRGAQGVALTPGRSIAVDPQSIPYGTPVWLASKGAAADLQRLVFAQDTGSAIVGAVRADYFAGWGPDAADLAGKLKQGLRLWVLWPK